MKITSDLFLRGDVWLKLREVLIDKHQIFARVVDYFVVACSIGVAADAWTESDGDLSNTIARDTYQVNYDISDIFDFMFKNAILTSKLIDYPIDIRLKMAFDDEFKDDAFSTSLFIVKFANYGAQKILEICSEHDIETADNFIELVNDYIADNYKDNMDKLLEDIEF